MKKVYLHGKMGEKFGSEWHFNVKTIPEALRAIDCNCEGFLDYFQKKINEGNKYFIFKKDYRNIKSKKDFEDSLVLDKDEALLEIESEEIHLVPSVQGSIPGLGEAIAAWAVEFFTVSTLINIVVMTAISYGIAMLTKPPDEEEADVKTITSKSYVMNGASNRAAQGIPVPIGYGRLMVGSVNIGLERVIKKSSFLRSESDQVLQSFSTTRFLELICEGPIEGFVDQKGVKLAQEDWEKAVFLNEVPVRNEDGTYNYILSEEKNQSVVVDQIADVTPSISISTGDEDNFSQSASFSDGINYIKEYNKVMYGPSPYTIKNAAFVVEGEDSGLQEIEKAKKYGAKIFSHFVSNVSVGQCIFSFAARLSKSDIQGNTSPETCRFAILVQRFDGEFNILDKQSGCRVKISDDFRVDRGGIGIYEDESANIEKWEFGYKFYWEKLKDEEMQGENLVMFPMFRPKNIDEAVESFRTDPHFAERAKGFEDFVDRNEQAYSSYKEKIKSLGIFCVNGIATESFEFQISCDFDFNFGTSEINEGITFKIIKLSPEYDPSISGDADIAGMRKVRSISFVSAQEKVDCSLRYPHSAICSVEFDSRNFENTPSRAYHLKLKKVLIPSNYDPILRKYIDDKGNKTPWDGLFKGQQPSVESLNSISDFYKYWTDNPAFILFDLIQNPRFGVSRYGLEEGSIDKWQIYKIAKYCDELVSTGYIVETKTQILRSFFTSGIIKFDKYSDILDGNYGYMEISVDDNFFYNSGDNRVLLQSKKVGRSDYSPLGLNRDDPCTSASLEVIFDEVLGREPTSEEASIYEDFSIGRVCDSVVFKLNEQSPQSVFFDNDFKKEFGSGSQFAGKKIAFFSSDHDLSSFSPDVKLKIQKDSCLKNGGFSIEERVLLDADPVSRKIYVSGPSFKEDFKPVLNPWGDELYLGGCACQVNHPLVEPRFSSNFYITDQTDALSALNHVCSIFRGIPSYYSGKISSNHDFPKKTRMLFTNSNIHSDGFSYSGSHKAQKYTSSLVRFNNKEKNFAPDVIVEEDSKALQRIGFQQKETIGFGITSESQARRLARWTLHTANSEVDAVSFKTSLPANLLHPGSIFEVSDEMRVGKGRSGRISEIIMTRNYDLLNEENEPALIEDPYILLDKFVSQGPSPSRVELSVSVGTSSGSFYSISDRSLEEKTVDDQDVEINNVQSSQILRFDCSVGSLGEASGKSLGADRPSILEDFLLKISLEVDVKNNTFKAYKHGFISGSRVRFLSSGILPAGLDVHRVNDRSYFIVNETDHTFQVSKTNNGEPVFIYNEGFDTFLQRGGSHFVCPENLNGKTSAATLEYLGQIQKGANFSISGRVNSEISNVGTTSLNSSELSNIGVFNTSFANFLSWQYSTILGQIYISSKEWVLSADFGWVYISYIIDSPAGDRWIFIEGMGWTLIDVAQNYWWIPYYHEHQTISPWVFKSEKNKLFIRDSDWASKKKTDYVYIGGYSHNPYGKKFLITYVSDSSLGYWVKQPSAELTEEASPEPPSSPESVDISGPHQGSSSLDHIYYIDSLSSEQGSEAIGVKLLNSQPLASKINPSVIIEGLESESHNFNALINKKWEAVYIDDLNLELIGSNLEAADFLQDSYQINDYGKVKYESVASSIFLNFLEKKLYRTLSVKELPDGEFEVSGMEYNFQKFKSVDENESLRTPYFPIPPQADMSVPDSPSDLELEDNTYRGVFK